jgi:hypothetical protein
MTEDRKILIYGLSEDEKERLYTEALALHQIHDGNAGGTLAELIEKKEIPHVGSPLGIVKIMIFCGYETNDELKDLISKIRKEHVFGSIMAVITKTNLNWKFDYMIEHLLEEREDNKQFEKDRRAKLAENLG